MTRPSLTVAIATLGRPDPLRRALVSLATSGVRPDAVIVVDGADSRSAAEVVEQAAAALPVRHVVAPRGLTRQRNAALDLVQTDIVLFLDDDARVRPDTLERVLQPYQDPNVVGATGRTEEPASNRIGGKNSRVRALLRGRAHDGTFTSFGYPRRLVDESRTTDVEFMAGCFMSARSQIARAVRFDEALTGYALAEDEDFSYRLSRYGRVSYVADAVVDHDNTGFGGRDRRAFGHQVVRNRWYLYRKNFPQTAGGRVRFELLMALLVVHRLLNRDLAGARGLAEAALRRPRPSTPYGVDS